MQLREYQEALDWLFQKAAQGYGRPGLGRMKKACEALGNPQNQFRSIHVAGTNGKGSVSTKIAEGCRLSGLKTGLYTSPHLFSFCERIQIDGVCIDKEAVVQGFSYIRERCGEELSVFEITTLLAFWWYQKNGVDIAILEVGLGGTYDATNVCVPEFSVITSISLDHTEILGETPEEITREKAGIVKPNVPVVIGPRVPVLPVAEVCTADLIVVRGTWSDYDEENSQIAAEVLRKMCIPNEVISKALLVRPPCRYQQVEAVNAEFQPPAIIIDVAHNPDGMKRLFMKFRAQFPTMKPCVLLSVSREKDAETMLETLNAEGATVFCTQNGSDRSMSAEALSSLARHYQMPSFEYQDSRKAVENALKYASLRKMVLLVTGTFFLMEEIQDFFTFKKIGDIGIHSSITI